MKVLVEEVCIKRSGQTLSVPEPTQSHWITRSGVELVEVVELIKLFEVDKLIKLVKSVEMIELVGGVELIGAEIKTRILVRFVWIPSSKYEQGLVLILLNYILALIRILESLSLILLERFH